MKDPYNNQFGNQHYPGVKGYSVRIFLTPEQQTRLREAVSTKKEYLQKLSELYANEKLPKKFPNPTMTSVLSESFSYMENEYLDRLIDAFIYRTTDALVKI